MATPNLKSEIKGYCILSMTIQTQTYNDIKFSILDNLFPDIILGQNFMEKHSAIMLSFGGDLSPLNICSLAVSNVTPPTLFSHLSKDSHPIVTKSRKYSHDDKSLIDSEIKRLLAKHIIEPSNSPWRAQVVITANENRKKRLCIDYSQTINRSTHLDAHPLPKVDDQVKEIANFKIFSALDLKSAYHQIPLLAEDKIYAAFEANGKLYQFIGIPFGLTNAVAAFQRNMDNFIAKNDLKNTWAYLDNLSTAGNTQKEHNENLSKLLAAAKQHNFTFKKNKSIISVDTVKLLDYVISHKNIRPDPERLEPLRNMYPPKDQKSKQRITGMFSYYSQFIKNFSDKIQPLVKADTYLINSDAENAF